MAKTLLCIPAFLIAFFSAVSVTHAASFCEPEVQRDWPSWIGQLGACAQQEGVIPAQGEVYLPRIPEFYQSINYRRWYMQPVVQPSTSPTQGERVGAEWWPDWIGKPAWY
ncbi:MAG: hypothetical protein PHU04_01780 [Candidatus Peribacteraceae bacterium]|nr:hypothetical protein [Candidatus Peribacteraceae bacterium]